MRRSALTRGRVVSLAMIALGVPNLLIGAWAAFAPANWYRNFPTSGSPWISVDGPYNEHLVIDAGAGLLMLGAVLVGGAFLDHLGRRFALVASLFQIVPHVRYHLANPLPDTSTAQQVASTGTLVFALVAVLVLLLVDRQAPPSPPLEGAVP